MVAAQASAPPPAQSSGWVISQIRVGMRLEARDRKNPHMICVASIKQVDVAQGKVEIYFDGWSNNFNYWCEPNDNDLHPVGWCQANSYKLERPKG